MVKDGCWNINPGCGTGSCPDACPALANNTPCWEFDWGSVLSGMGFEEQDYWRGFISSHCIVCPIYQDKPQEIEKILNSI